MNQSKSPLAHPGSSTEDLETTKVDPNPRQSKILYHSEQFTTQRGAKDRVEIISSHEVQCSSGCLHFLVRLYEARKGVFLKSDEQFSGERVVNLVPGEESGTDDKRKRRAAKSMDEYSIRGKIKIVSNVPVASGGSCQVYQGRFHREGQKKYEMVALKRLNVADTLEKDRKMFRRETNAWNKLRHPNVLPFYGTFSLKKNIYMVSPWAKNGDLRTYLEGHPGVDRLPLLIQIADALRYLHDECKLIHGDVKFENILVSDEDNALLADFGIVMRIKKLPGAITTGTGVPHMMTIRYAARELLAAVDKGNDEKVVSSAKSPASDVYAFGLLMISVYTMRTPWNGMPIEQVIAGVLQREKPPTPTEEAFSRGLTKFILQLAEKCLEADPNERPTMVTIVGSLKEGPHPDDANVKQLISESTVKDW